MLSPQPAPKAIILAAGQGQRLKPLTNDRPKGMVEINGSTIIERQLKLFRKVGIDRVCIVKGFCASSVPDYGACHYINEEYASTNMVYSLFAAGPELVSGPVVVSYGDIVYSEQVLRSLLGTEAPVAVVVDLAWKAYFAQRFADPFDDAESLVLDASGAIRSIGQSRPSLQDVQAQYIGLIKFQDAGLAHIRKIQESFSNSDATLGWGRAWRKAYMTDLLQELVNQGERVMAVPISRGWCEIDSPRDFELAGPIVDRFLV
jgi:choline kinase